MNIHYTEERIEITIDANGEQHIKRTVTTSNQLPKDVQSKLDERLWKGFSEMFDSMGKMFEGMFK